MDQTGNYPRDITFRAKKMHDDKSKKVVLQNSMLQIRKSCK